MEVGMYKGHQVIVKDNKKNYFYFELNDIYLKKKLDIKIKKVALYLAKRKNIDFVDFNFSFFFYNDSLKYFLRITIIEK